MTNGTWHEKNGRFKKGNPGGGRKPRATEDEIRAALHSVIPTDKVLKKLNDAIDQGESWAIALYFAYDWGKPRERVEYTGEDGGPLALVVRYENPPNTDGDGPA